MIFVRQMQLPCNNSSLTTYMAHAPKFLQISRYLLITAVLLLSVLTVSAQTDPVQPQSGEVEIFLAKDDGTGQAGEQVTSFKTSDAKIYCIVQLPSSTPATVKMQFVAVSVTGVKPETRVVTTSYTTKDGEDRVSFHGKPKTTWVAGKYRVEIFVDGKSVKELPFDIIGPTKVLGSSFAEPASKPKPASIRKPKQN